MSVPFPVFASRGAVEERSSALSDSGLAQSVEDLAVEQFVAQASIAALDVTFSQGLPRSM
jgi:hypothetical protein